MSFTNPGPAVSQGTTVANVGSDANVGKSTGKVGFYEKAPVVQQTVAAAGTDAGTTQALANSLRTALINLGLVKA
jgi:hypothetical protein